MLRLSQLIIKVAAIKRSLAIKIKEMSLLQANYH